MDEFQVTLEVFQGPFDLLLQLISRQRLDITQVALAQVTDEFIAHMQAFPDLSRTTEFLVVAATLLDMKAAHLLPRELGEDERSREDLEARDLLFSRLLQYRAFKEASAVIERRLEEHAGLYAREVPLEPHFAVLLPELLWLATPEDLARAAADALSATPTQVTVTHLHDPVVPVAEQLEVLVGKLELLGRAHFRELIEDAGTRAVVVSRFLALLELYRQRAVEFDQKEPRDDLVIVWVGRDGTPTDYVVEEYNGEDHPQ
ncbi:ScpA family protein [Schaalia sp. Marseille-Q2122]|uniref:segregation and condensation protein A n=1 Tax=Schaalia sp. Marseille-Q2122 TaxID=2736604 RepID=UPI0020CA51E9|nr:ScpA family protein [Schaalia sp. Marseille-Q2122]